MIKAQIVADSINEFGNRITTMILTYPRIIHSEIMTHRMFSRNAASSRAVPFEKLLKAVNENPFIPIAFQRSHSGMQGIEYFPKDWERDLRERWLKAKDLAIQQATSLHNIGVTKQLCNRLLEPFQFYTCIVTATEFENFFALRCPQYSLFYEQIPMEFRSKKDLLKFVEKVEAPQFKDSYKNLNNIEWLQCNKGQAEIHMMALAEVMWDTYNESTPKELKEGEWHIPFGDNILDQELVAIRRKQLGENEIGISFNDIDKLKIKIATARCARVSYTVVGEEDKKDNYENDIKLHDRLAVGGHWSPFEHCAKAMNRQEFHDNIRGEITWAIDGIEDETKNKDAQGWSGNFRGFIQYRKMLENENITK